MATKRTPEEIEARRKIFERKKADLSKTCDVCRKRSGMPTIDHCNYGCTIGRKLRMLEAEYSDVTGWSHELWKSERTS